MGLAIAQGTLASAVAASGTFTASYPTGYFKGSFDNSVGHKLVIGGGSIYYAPQHFTLTFNTHASGITVTWASGMATLPAGTRWTLEMQTAGQDDHRPYVSPSYKQVDASTWLINLGSPAVADADGISESQSVTASVAAVLDGVLADPYGNVRAVFDAPRNVVGAWTGAAVITIVGKDEFGKVMYEKSASGTSHTGKKAFKEITSITPSANITAATFGTGDVLGLPVFLPSLDNIMAEFVDGNMIKRRPSSVIIPWELEQTQLLAPTPEQIASPVAGRITLLQTIIQAAVTTGGAITVNVGATPVDGLSITVADAATAGTVQSDTPTAGHATAVVAVGDAISIVPAAAFATAGEVNGNLVIETSDAGLLDGTAVAGVADASSYTSGDVRGTYDPSAALDGLDSYQLLIWVADPASKGAPQFAP